MKPRFTALLVLLAVIAVGAGWYWGLRREPAAETSAPGGKLVFPGLAARLHDAATVEIAHGGNTVTLDRAGDGAGEGWGLASSGNYPVQPSKLRELLTGLTELRLAEPRTSDPAEFARLSVEDPAAKGADSTLVRVLDAGGQPLAALIVGRTRPRAEGNVPDEVYVRRPDENQSWLAEGQVPVNTGGDAKQWLDKFVVDIDANMITGVTATRGADHLEFAGKDGVLKMTAPTDHPPLDDSRVTEVGRALERVTFVDVRKDDAGSGSETAHSVFTTKDDQKIDQTMLKLGDETWVRVTATGDGSGAEAAKQLAARTHGWLYQLGSWKERNLFPAMDDVKAPPPPKPEAGAQGGKPATLPPGPLSLPTGHPTLQPPAGGSAPGK